jgi:hypothetical protein
VVSLKSRLRNYFSVSVLLDYGIIIPGDFSRLFATRKHVRWSRDDNTDSKAKIWRCTYSLGILHPFSFSRLNSLCHSSLYRQTLIISMTGTCKSVVNKTAWHARTGQQQCLHLEQYVYRWKTQRKVNLNRVGDNHADAGLADERRKSRL